MISHLYVYIWEQNNNKNKIKNKKDQKNPQKNKLVNIENGLMVSMEGMGGEAVDEMGKGIKWEKMDPFKNG